MPKNTRHIKTIEEKLHFSFPEYWWDILASQLKDLFSDDTLNFKIQTNSFLAKNGHNPPFNAWAVTIGDNVHITKSFGWRADWRDVFTEDSANLKTIFSVIAHEIYHVKDQKRVGFWKWMIKYSLLRPFYTAKSHPMEKPAYKLAEDIKHKLTPKL
tara:strand:- start:1541 stop:2008 length:468 start_codon:yes stop_codon:yes gene_type:complete